jgi:serine/threonine protein kinase
MRHLGDQARADHPQIRRFRFPPGKDVREFYLKIYYPTETLKDLFRDSQAFRAMRQGIALSDRGFHVPVTIAAGEEREIRFLKRAFLLTRAIEAVPLPLFIRDHYSFPLNPGALKAKRAHLKQLALEIRRMHQVGFVHGDLIPNNILVQAKEDTITFFYLDNDRTKRYPAWFPERLWRRNLVQLNRFVLPGIFLEDRMRFLKFYLSVKCWGGKERRLAQWLEKKTRKRRREVERIETQPSFRELMRWEGPFAKNIRQ